MKLRLAFRLYSLLDECPERMMQDPFVDFATSDPEARAILLKTAFQLHARLSAKRLPGLDVLVSPTPLAKYSYMQLHFLGVCCLD